MPLSAFQAGTLGLAALGTAGQIGGVFTSAKRQYKYQRKLQENAYSIWLRQLAAQNQLNIENYEKYQSPLATVREYAKAGLGPAAMLDSVSFAPGVSSPEAPGVGTGQAGSFNYGQAGAAVTGLAQLAADIDLKNAMADDYRSSAGLKDTQRSFTEEQIIVQRKFATKLDAEVGVLKSEESMNSFRAGILKIELANTERKIGLELDRLGREIDAIDVDIDLKKSMKLEALASAFEKVTKGAVNLADARRLVAVANLTNEQYKDLEYQVRARLKHGSYDEMAKAETLLDDLRLSQKWLNDSTAAVTHYKAASEVLKNYGAATYYGVSSVHKIFDIILSLLPKVRAPYAVSKALGGSEEPSIPLVPGLGD